MNGIYQDKGSFRDPRGYIYHCNGRLLRAVLPPAAEDFERVRATGLIAELIAKGKLIPEQIVDKDLLKAYHPQLAYVLEHPRLTFISYPYEWPFSLLKAAALHVLEIHLEALQSGVSLTDASAYNIQFQGIKPLFIDHLAFCRYEPGSLWQGYRQFCQHFLNPLLLKSVQDVAYQAWYRGSLEGITAQELRQVLPFFCKFNPKVFLHVVLQSALQKCSNREVATVFPTIKLPEKKLKKMLNDFYGWISALQRKKNKPTYWENYPTAHKDFAEKAALVSRFISALKPNCVYDLGCNTGEYAQLALAAGAKTVIGFDSDEGALEQAVLKATQHQLAFLPLWMDLANPSPCQGWRQNERMGLEQRGCPDALFALAIVHHLAIARNIPLNQIVDWLLDLAPQGLIEFVPKEDPLLQEMLQLRADIFVDYTLDHFLGYLRQRGKIIEVVPLKNSKRCLIWYKKL